MFALENVTRIKINSPSEPNLPKQLSCFDKLIQTLNHCPLKSSNTLILLLLLFMPSFSEDEDDDTSVHEWWYKREINQPNRGVHCECTFKSKGNDTLSWKIHGFYAISRVHHIRTAKFTKYIEQKIVISFFFVTHQSYWWRSCWMHPRKSGTECMSCPRRNLRSAAIWTGNRTFSPLFSYDRFFLCITSNLAFLPRVWWMDGWFCFLFLFVALAYSYSLCQTQPCS